MVAIVCLIFAIHLCISLKKPFWGLLSLIVIKILIPDNVRFPIGDASLNTVISFVLFCSWLFKSIIAKRHTRTTNKLNIYIFFIILYCGLNMLFTYTSVPIAYQFRIYTQYVFLQLLPIVVMIDVVKTKEELLLLIYTFGMATLICVVYSLFCYITFIPYPYNAFINSVYEGRVEDIGAEMDIEMGGVVGRCMGTATSGTWDYGMVISMLFVCVGSIYQVIKNKFFLIVWILAGIDLLCTVRRAPVITGLIFLLILFLLKDRTKILRKVMTIFAAGIVLIAVIYVFPQLSAFRHILESSIFFWDDSVSEKNDVKGSNVGFRTYQLLHTLQYVKDSPIFGNGWGSCFYKNKYPDMIGWESIIFTTLMQFGYLGFLLWMNLYYKFYLYCKESKMKLISFAFMAAAMAFSIINDTIYPFYIFFGAVLINKFRFLTTNNLKKNASIRFKNY